MNREKTAMTSKSQSVLVLWLKMHIYMMLAGVLAICIAIGYYYFFISRPSFEYGSLHIKDIIPVKELKSWQSEMDVLVNIQTSNDKYFTSLVTTEMAAGVSMDNVTVTEDSNTIHVRIPPAKMFSLATKGEKYIRENGLDQQTIDAVKVFAKAYASSISIHEHRLATAQNEAARLIGNFAQIVARQKNKTVDVTKEPMPEERARIITMRSRRTGIFLSHFPLINKWQAHTFPSEDARYALYGWHSQNADVSLYAMGMVEGSTLLSPFKCARSDQYLAQQFNPMQPSLPFKMLADPVHNRAFFCWQAGGQVYEMDFNAKDESAYQTKLPDALMLAYGVHYDPEFHLGKGSSYALGGITHADWVKIPFNKRLAYVLDIMRHGQPLGLTPMKSYKGVKVFVETDKPNVKVTATAATLGGESSIGLSAYQYTDIDDEDSAKKLMDQLWNNIPGRERSSIKVIFFDPENGYVHRERMVALSAKKIYFFIPERLFQGQIMEQVFVKEMQNGLNDVLKRDDDDGEWEVDGKSFHSSDFNQFLDAIANRNFFNMLSWQP